jgi:hypothetical protein
MTLQTETQSIRDHVKVIHKLQYMAATTDYSRRNAVETTNFQDYSISQGAGSWVYRTYNEAGEEISFMRENGWNTVNTYFGPYVARLRYSEMGDTYPANINHSLSGDSVDTNVSLDYTENEDGDIRSFCFRMSTRKGSSMEVDRNGVRITIYPDHPNYADYNYPEEEVEPSAHGEELIMGKQVYISL